MPSACRVADRLFGPRLTVRFPNAGCFGSSGIVHFFVEGQEMFRHDARHAVRSAIGSTAGSSTSTRTRARSRPAEPMRSV
jgi:hypothetical protein